MKTRSGRPRGRPLGGAVCAYCGALPCHQRPLEPAAVPQAPRFLIAAVSLPGGGTRRLYAHSEQAAQAAQAALLRDPALLHTMAFDAFEDIA